MRTDEKEPKKQTWVIVEDESTDKIKNRPEWASEKDREELIFEPKPPTALEDWINNK